MAVLRKAFDAILDRIEFDEGIRKFFDQAETDADTKQIVGNYVRVGIGDVGPFQVSKIAPTVGGATLNQTNVNLVITLVIEHDDSDAVAEMILKGIEVFVNAIEKKDVIFGKLFVNKPIINFTAPVSLEGSGNKNQVEVNGTLAFTIQPYTGGAL